VAVHGGNARRGAKTLPAVAVAVAVATRTIDRRTRSGGAAISEDERRRARDDADRELAHRVAALVLSEEVDVEHFERCGRGCRAVAERAGGYDRSRAPRRADTAKPAGRAKREIGRSKTRLFFPHSTRPFAHFGDAQRTSSSTRDPRRTSPRASLA